MRRQVLPMAPFALAPLLLFGLFQMQYGDFFAYFHSGDNIHSPALPSLPSGPPFWVITGPRPPCGSTFLTLWGYCCCGVPATMICPCSPQPCTCR